MARCHNTQRHLDPFLASANSPVRPRATANGSLNKAIALGTFEVLLYLASNAGAREPSLGAEATAASANASETEAPARTEKPVTRHHCNRFGGKDHLLGAAMDTGGGSDSVGVRYLHSHRAGSGCDGLGAFSWLAYGVETRVTFAPAAIGYAVSRFGGVGDGGGGGVELGVGGGTDLNETRIVGFAGLFYSMYYVDLGGVGHFPIGGDRPDWLGGFQFAMRLHVPLRSYDEYDERQHGAAFSGCDTWNFGHRKAAGCSPRTVEQARGDSSVPF